MHDNVNCLRDMQVNLFLSCDSYSLSVQEVRLGGGEGGSKRILSVMLNF